MLAPGPYGRHMLGYQLHAGTGALRATLKLFGRNLTICDIQPDTHSPEMAEYFANESKNPRYLQFSPDINSVVIISAKNIALLSYHPINRGVSISQTEKKSKNIRFPIYPVCRYIIDILSHLWRDVSGCGGFRNKEYATRKQGLTEMVGEKGADALKLHYAIVRIQPSRSPPLDLSTDIWVC